MICNYFIDSEFELNKLKNNSPLLQIADIISEFIEKNPEKFKQILTKYENQLNINNNINNDIKNDKTLLSHRNDHKEWFEGQDNHYQTKEEILSKKAQDRLRGYYYKTKDEITKHKLYRTNYKAKEIFDKILVKFRYLLIGCNFFSVLFDRNYNKKHSYLNDEIDTSKYIIPNKKLRKIIKDYTIKNQYLNEWLVSLCTNEGNFYCQGSFSENNNKINYYNNHCNKRHIINPYSSRENLILFQIWNLDHQIEITRTIIPSIINNVQNLIENPNLKCKKHKQKIIDISIIEYFLELFTVKNLKLVHIVCHEKIQRTNKSNGKLICEKCNEYEIIKDLEDNIFSLNEDCVDF